MRYEDPWAKAGNQAVNALYKYYMSQPNPGDMQKRQLENQLLTSRNSLANAQILTEQAQRERLQNQTAIDSRRLNSTNDLANLISGFYEPVQSEAPRTDESMVGPMPAVNTAPSQDMIAERMTAARPDLMKAAANYSIASPSSIGTVMESFLRGAGEQGPMLDNFKQDFTLSPGAIRFTPQGDEIASAPFKDERNKGSYIQLPDGTVVSLDGGQPPFRPNVVGNLQEKDISFDTYKTFAENYRKTLDANPGAAGTRGNIARLADGLLGQVRSLAPDSPVAGQLNSVVDALAGQFTDPATGQVMNQDLYAASTVANLLPFIAAEAVVGQSGRSLSDTDRALIQATIGSPDDWLATPDKLRARMTQLDTIVDNLRVKYQNRLIGGSGVMTSPLNTPQPNQKPVQRWTRGPDGVPVPVGGQ